MVLLEGPIRTAIPARVHLGCKRLRFCSAYLRRENLARRRFGNQVPPAHESRGANCRAIPHPSCDCDSSPYAGALPTRAKMPVPTKCGATRYQQRSIEDRRHEVQPERGAPAAMMPPISSDPVRSSAVMKSKRVSMFSSMTYESAHLDIVNQSLNQTVRPYRMNVVNLCNRTSRRL